MEILSASQPTDAEASPPAALVGMTEPGGELKPSLREVFAAEETPLLRYAYGLVRQRETAEDLVQEAFLRLHAHWDKVGTPRAWLYRAVRNLALNHLRDHRRETPMEITPEPPSPAADPGRALCRDEALGTLQLLLAGLREEERSLIGLKYHDGLKYEQISERTGLSVGNVGYKLHHLLKDLAASLRSLGIESADG